MSTRTNWLNFDDSMKKSENYCKRRTKQEEWDNVKTKYETVRKTPVGKQRVPKILHQIWMGGDIPDKQRSMCEQVKNALPSDWEYKLWLDDDVSDIPDFTTIEYFEKTPNFGQKSDIIRNEILYEYGGVYLDTDFILYKNLDQFLDMDYIVGVGYDEWPSVLNGMIFSSPKNDIADSMRKYDVTPDWSNPMSVINSTGPFHSYRKLINRLNENVLILPVNFFYPFPGSLRHNKNYQDYVEEESVACHLWECSWQ